MDFFLFSFEEDLQTEKTPSIEPELPSSTVAIDEIPLLHLPSKSSQNNLSTENRLSLI